MITAGPYSHLTHTRKPNNYSTPAIIFLNVALRDLFESHQNVMLNFCVLQKAKSLTLKQKLDFVFWEIYPFPD